MRLPLTVAVLLLALVPAASAQSTPTKKKAPRALLDGPNVTREQREFLRGKMRLHADAMQDLVLDVAVLDYAAVKERAAAIAGEGRIDRKAGEAAGLSPSFFDLQDQMRKRSRDMVDLADKEEPEALSGAMTDILNTCMGCHNVFRRPAAADGGTPPGPKK